MTTAVPEQYFTCALIVGALLALVATVPVAIAVRMKNSNRRNAASRASAWSPPGWHPSPQHPGQVQWWDGAQWTQSFAPAEQ